MTALIAYKIKLLYYGTKFFYLRLSRRNQWTIDS